MINGIYLLLGTNLGDKKNNLKKAVEELESICKILMMSSLYRSAAWGKTDQPEFYNQALQISTSLTPEELLRAILGIEELLGRKREVRWGERLIDIDILFYGATIVSSPDLQIPHPEVQNRRFALVPMAEIAPQFRHPILDNTIEALLNKCPDTLPVVPL